MSETPEETPEEMPYLLAKDEFCGDDMVEKYVGEELSPEEVQAILNGE